MEDIYKNLPPSAIPWNSEQPPELLLEFIKSHSIQPCKTLDIGCGMGNYAIYLSKQGFDVTGVDVSPTAIAHAKESAKHQKIHATFIETDFLTWGNETLDEFSFIFDWEVLHHVYPKQRSVFLDNVKRLLVPGGYYFSACFHEDDPNFGGKGKYRITSINTRLYFSSMNELRKLYQPRFNILELKTVEVPGRTLPHVAALAVLQSNKKP